MNRPKELDVDFISSQDKPLTKEEERKLSEYFQKQKSLKDAVLV